MTDDMIEKGLTRPPGPIPPALAGIAIAVAVALHFLWPGFTVVPWPWSLVGVVPMIVGGVLARLAMRWFERAGADVMHFAEETILVTDGPYAVSRNPMYLSLVMTTAGVALLLGTATPWIGPVVLAIWLDQAYVRREERHMRGLFGEAFDAYRARVRRWI